MTDRSRRTLLAALAATAAGGGLAACGSAPEPGPGGTAGPTGSTDPADSPGSPGPSESAPRTSSAPPSSSSSAPRSDTPCADQLSMEQRVGQLMMMGVNSSGATADQLDILATTRAGAVIMMGNHAGGRDGVRTITDELRSTAEQADGVELLVATDQEGGLVQRLTGPGLDTIPAAATQATWSTATLRQRAERWGKQLKQAGVDSSLAPVADVVPPEIGTRNKPIAANKRGYGSDPETVSDKVVAVVEGLRAGVKAGTDMVMAATAIYTKIDADHVAALSEVVIEDVLREKLGWRGVVISDDLGVAKAVAHLAPGERALGFLRAGGDLVINVDPSSVTAMVQAITAEAGKDDDFAAAITQKAERVLQLKAGRGLAECPAN